MTGRKGGRDDPMWIPGPGERIKSPMGLIRATIATPRLAAGGLLAVLVLGASAEPVRAELLVVFRDSRSLAVESAERQGEEIRLGFGGGGVAVVPATIVARIVPASERPSPRAETSFAAWRQTAGSYASIIESAAERFGLAPELIVAVASVESRFDPFAESPKGAIGVMQLMPETAAELGVDNPFDAEQNILGGARFLREMLDEFEGDLDLALAAYNAGSGRVREYGGVPPFPETRRYLVKVRERVEELQRGIPSDV